MYMQRVIDPSKISELTQLSIDAGGEAFNLAQIERHLDIAKSALSEADFGVDRIEALMEFARDIGDVDKLSDLEPAPSISRGKELGRSTP